MQVSGRAVRLELVPPAVPHLQPVEGSGVSVSCHLFHEPHPE
jgi:hypothetical protein